MPPVCPDLSVIESLGMRREKKTGFFCGAGSLNWDWKIPHTHIWPYSKCTVIMRKAEQDCDWQCPRVHIKPRVEWFGWSKSGGTASDLTFLLLLRVVPAGSESLVSFKKHQTRFHRKKRTFLLSLHYYLFFIDSSKYTYRHSRKSQKNCMATGNLDPPGIWSRHIRPWTMDPGFSTRNGQGGAYPCDAPILHFVRSFALYKQDNFIFMWLCKRKQGPRVF